MMLLQCKKCREVLATDKEVSEFECRILNESTVFYLQEDSVPVWIKTSLDKGGWMKGRLNCPKCHGRVGSFDFVSGFKCDCGKHVVPPVHIIRSKVDIFI